MTSGGYSTPKADFGAPFVFFVLTILCHLLDQALIALFMVYLTIYVTREAVKVSREE